MAGLYLTGSVPLGDFHPGTSDIDGVVILASPLESSEPVKEVHAALPAKPAYDVTYLTAAQLAVPPDPEKPVVFTLDGVFKVAPHGGPVSPVLWSEMARNAVPVRTAPGLVVHDDQQALRDYTRGNLTSYWEPTLDKVATAVESLHSAVRSSPPHSNSSPKADRPRIHKWGRGPLGSDCRALVYAAAFAR